MSTCTSVEIGRPHSTNEAGEQSRRVWVGSGVRRGKGVDQGERITSALAPDTEPGMRVTGVVARTTSCKKGQAEAVDTASVSERAAGRHMNPR